eukprot:7391976-Prymnesium_polylepis.5
MCHLAITGARKDDTPLHNVIRNQAYECCIHCRAEGNSAVCCIDRALREGMWWATPMEGAPPIHECQWQRSMLRG